MQRSVVVWDRPFVVMVRQKSKSVWIAVGDYFGERIEAKGNTENAAVARWQAAAQYKKAAP